jgi:hypothetical protein
MFNNVLLCVTESGVKSQCQPNGISSLVRWIYIEADMWRTYQVGEVRMLGCCQGMALEVISVGRAKIFGQLVMVVWM